MDMDMIDDFSQPILLPFRSLQLSTSSLDFGAEFASNKTPGRLAEDINGIIKLHEACRIERFRLHFPPLDIFVSDIDDWIAFAVAKGVQVLELDFSMGLGKLNDLQFLDVATAYRLPDSLYRCNAITQLSLNYCNFHPPLDYSISFPGLQSLSLTSVSIRAHVLETMITNSPQLANLSLVNLFPVDMDDMESIKVLGQELRRLAIIKCLFIKIEICAPKLQSFIFYGEYCFGSQYRLNESSNVNVPMLEDAFISSYDMEFAEPVHDYIMLLSDIRHVKILTVCSATLMRFDIYHFEEILPLSLPNLRELQLLVTLREEYYFQIIWSFFKLCHTPILEKLFLRIMRIPEEFSDDHDQLEDVQESAEVVFTHLRLIKVSNFVGTKIEMSLVRLLLQRAVCLENLVLVTPKSFESIRRLNGAAAEEAFPGPKNSFLTLLHQISVLPKASPKANVILVKFEEDDLAFAPTHQECYVEL